MPPFMCKNVQIYCCQFHIRPPQAVRVGGGVCGGVPTFKLTWFCVFFFSSQGAVSHPRWTCVTVCVQLHIFNSAQLRKSEINCSQRFLDPSPAVWVTDVLLSLLRVCAGTEDRRLSYECNSKPVCPAKCRCEANVVDCSNLRLTKFPEHLPSSTEELWDTHMHTQTHKCSLITHSVRMTAPRTTNYSTLVLTVIYCRTDFMCDKLLRERERASRCMDIHADTHAADRPSW